MERCCPRLYLHKQMLMAFQTLETLRCLNNMQTFALVQTACGMSFHPEWQQFTFPCTSSEERSPQGQDNKELNTACVRQEECNYYELQHCQD